MVNSCCVPECHSSGREWKMHMIPLQLHNEWLVAIGRIDLVNKPPAAVRQSYRVCDAHFTDDQKVPGFRSRSNLKKNAIPSLRVPGSAMESHVNRETVSNTTTSSKNDSGVFESVTSSCVNRQTASNLSTFRENCFRDSPTSNGEGASTSFKESCAPNMRNCSENDFGNSSSTIRIVNSTRTDTPRQEGSLFVDFVAEQEVMERVNNIPVLLDQSGVPSVVEPTIEGHFATDISTENGDPSQDQSLPSCSFTPLENVGTPKATSLPSSQPSAISERRAEALHVVTTPSRKRKREEECEWVTPKRPADLKKKMRILGAASVTRAKRLTPKALRFYTIAKSLRKVGRKSESERSSLAERLKAAERSLKSNDHLLNRVNSSTRHFLLMQLQQVKKRRGRRYTLDQKLLALSIMKQGPRAYRLLERLFALPSKKVLQSLLNRLPFSVGLNPNIMASLKGSVEKMKPLDRHCILIFDEMTLQPSLLYNKKEDVIEGFQDNGTRAKVFADHACTFMLRGLCRKWKQIVGYYLVQNGIDCGSLAKAVREIILSARGIGLRVVATVCDQSAVNVRAMKNLEEASRADFLRQGKEMKPGRFFVDEDEVIILYDPPHMLKGIRNNMLTKPVTFTEKNNVEKAWWEDIVTLYENDTGDGDFKMLNKLTDEHVYASRIKKMKVSYAAQVLSQRVASTMNFLAKKGSCLSPYAEGTAHFLLLIDKLFDSFNGRTVKPEAGKPFRCALSKKSPHLAFWNEILPVMSSIRFLTKDGEEYVPPSVKNWIQTIRGVQDLWKNLKAAGFKFVAMRNLNQDPLENTYGGVRNQGCRNINPTCTHFKAALKTLLVNNFMSPHAAGSNCEEDENDGALNSLKEFLLVPQSPNQQCAPSLTDWTFEEDEAFTFRSFNKLEVQFHAYIAGFVAKKILKSVGICKTCRSELVCRTTTNVHDYVEARAYSRKALLRPDTYFINVFSKCINVLQHYMPQLCVQKNLKSKLMLIINQYVGETTFTCKVHDTFKIFVDILVEFFIFTYTKNVNNILSGKDLRQRDETDEVKNLAFKRYTMYRKRREAMRKIKHLQ